MKKLKMPIFILTLFFPIFSFAIIHEIKHMNEIVNHIKPNALIILDIDDTLLIPVQTLGTDVWFTHRLDIYLSQGLEFEKALDNALAEWEAVRHITQVKTVEENTAAIVNTLQKQNYLVMGLTTQGLALTTRTINQLHSLDIDLSKNAPSDSDFYFLNGRGVLYTQGILFTAGTSKGKALIQLLDLIPYQPSLVVFINDKKTHLIDLESGLLERHIPFIGLRYGYCDERVQSFNSDLSDIQWKKSSFANILSDQEAQEILETLN